MAAEDRLQALVGLDRIRPQIDGFIGRVAVGIVVVVVVVVVFLVLVVVGSVANCWRRWNVVGGIGIDEAGQYFLQTRFTRLNRRIGAGQDVI